MVIIIIIINHIIVIIIIIIIIIIMIIIIIIIIIIFIEDINFTDKRFSKLNVVLNMGCNGDHFLSSEFCFFDGKRKRSRGFVTLTASVYHPLLRKQIPLVTMEAESEDQTNIILF